MKMFVNEDEEDTSSRSSSSTGTGFHHDYDESCRGRVIGVPSIVNRQIISSVENKALFRLRVMVVLVLTVSAVGIAGLVYSNARNGEQEHFESDFEDYAAKIFYNLGRNIQVSLEAMDAFVVSVVSFAQYNNMTWPFVTTPNFGTRASKLRSLTKSVLVTQIHTVSRQQRSLWEEYTMQEAPQWINQTIAIQNSDPTFNGSTINDYNTSGLWGHSSESNVYRPMWQSYPSLPLFGNSAFNLDATLLTSFTNAVHDLEHRKAVVGYISNDPGNATSRSQTDQLIRPYVDDDIDIQEPLSALYYPVYESVVDQVVDSSTSGTGFVAVLGSWFFWRDLLREVLPHGCNGIVVVFQNACSQTFSYEINGPDVVFLGYHDAHQAKYSSQRGRAELVDLLHDEDYTGYLLADTTCPYTVNVYPSENMESLYLTSDPWIYTSITIIIFVFTTIVFVSYDRFVERRQKKVLSSAAKSSAIVSSLFPPNIQARLYTMKDKDEGSHMESHRDENTMFLSDSSKDGAQAHVENSTLTGRPIADLFPHATVLFGDIAGFTAWSSTREPPQVFILLESLYALFDSLAIKRKVFKVETIGDCYMAVVGLPDPCPDHAVVAVKFARDCIVHMIELVEQLAFTLGPDTEDLAIRVGLHSGPVTAGVLRGQKSRFQLFGDTVNTASRMETTGLRNHIHVTEATAQELRKYKKGHWLRPRKETIQVKGKGQMMTYWVDPTGSCCMSNTDVESQRPSSLLMISGSPLRLGNRIEGLVDWNTSVLAKMLCAIVAFRDRHNNGRDNVTTYRKFQQSSLVRNEPKCILDEVRETIDFPEVDPSECIVDPDFVQLHPMVLSQLHDFVRTIADMYGGCTNPFHNFEHASHVCMSVTKLINCMTTTCRDLLGPDYATAQSIQHERTFGITSNPSTLFACVFAALIHDAGHPGVPNLRLVREGGPLVDKYNGRSVAEQASVDLAWNLFMTNQFQLLRETICATPAELSLFRQLIVNLVMATDIMDRDLQQRREKRWKKAFEPSIDNSIHNSESDASKSASTREETNRKATMVIEYLIQVSDIVHTMQHWHVYRKWNERLFEEMLQAYQMGRADKDPSEFWYKGEMDFFDKHVIPLAKKLKQCGVFGVWSDEYLNYALENRREWELKGKQVVEEMVGRRKNR